MEKIKWIKSFEPIERQDLIDKALETDKWLDKYTHKNGNEIYWDVKPESLSSNSDLLSSDTSVYAGSAGIAQFYLRLYLTTKEEKYLDIAKSAVQHCINSYRGVEDFTSDSDYLTGTFIGYLCGSAGGAYAASQIYSITGEEQYKEYALKVADDAIKASHEEDGKLFWYGEYGIIGEGSLILFLTDIYGKFGGEKYIEAAHKAAKFIVSKKEDAPQGGYRWYVMPTDAFPTIKKAGGYFPGFEYGAAGCGYILSSVYEYTKDEELLDTAKKAAEYILNIADYSEDKTAALVRYNDTYLTDLYYLGVCQGPVGTSRLFFKLYDVTKEEKYKDFVVKLTNGLIASGAPAKHSRGYWRTNCYCCGAPGMLEHFINIHKFTGDDKYLNEAFKAAEVIIGDSTFNEQEESRNWFTAWNRHEPFTSDAYTGLYHGTSGCAASLLALAGYIGGEIPKAFYLEDPYKKLYQ